jgi:hypothetical protein
VSPVTKIDISTPFLRGLGYIRIEGASRINYQTNKEYIHQKDNNIHNQQI